MRWRLYESVLFSAGGGALLGYFIGKAIRVIFKIIAVIIGVILAILAYLDYKGLITVHWQSISHQTQSAMYNASQVVMNTLNNTAQHISSHPVLMVNEGTPIAGGIGFTAGLIMGIRH